MEQHVYVYIEFKFPSFAFGQGAQITTGTLEGHCLVVTGSQTFQRAGEVKKQTAPNIFLFLFKREISIY